MYLCVYPSIYPSIHLCILLVLFLWRPHPPLSYSSGTCCPVLCTLLNCFQPPHGSASGTPECKPLTGASLYISKSELKTGLTLCVSFYCFPFHHP